MVCEYYFNKAVIQNVLDQKLKKTLKLTWWKKVLSTTFSIWFAFLFLHGCIFISPPFAFFSRSRWCWYWKVRGSLPGGGWQYRSLPCKDNMHGNSTSSRPSVWESTEEASPRCTLWWNFRPFDSWVLVTATGESQLTPWWWSLVFYRPTSFHSSHTRTKSSLCPRSPCLTYSSVHVYDYT